MADRPIYDATDETAENNAKRDAGRYARDDADALRQIMHSKKGRAWMFRLLERCHIFGSTFAGEQTHISAFYQGEENVGKVLMLEVQSASLDLYLTMMREQQEEAKRLDAVRVSEERKRSGSDRPPLTPDSQYPQDIPPPGSGAPPPD